jgi:DNA polymerase-1
MLVLDTETSGLDIYGGAEMFAFSTCTADDHTEVHRVDRGPKRKAEADDRLEMLLASAYRSFGSPLVFHNAKFDIAIIEKYLGRRLAEDLQFEDTMIMSQILQNDSPHGLKELAWTLARFPRDDEKAVKKFTANGRDWPKVPEFLMDTYQRNDGLRTNLLYHFFKPLIDENPAYAETYRILKELAWVTIRIEGRGVMLDRRKCKELRLKLLREAEEIQTGVQREFGRNVNLKSPEDVKWMLYERLKLPVLGYTKKAHKPSTDKNVLAELRAKFPGSSTLARLQHHRSWVRGASMMESYATAAGEDDIIHPEINPFGSEDTGSITGRETCSKPNLQNVQKSASLLNEFPVPARSVFRPRPGYVNLHIDYAGIELRLLVHYSADDILVDLLRKDGDPHALAAEVFFGGRFTDLDPKSVERKAMRDAAKGANFAIPYGANATKVASVLGLTPEEGRRVFNKYQAMFPNLVGLNRKFAAQVRDCGYIETSFGSRFYVPHDRPYAATNYLIQSTAAEIFKRGQVRLHKLLERTTQGRCGIILPVHDEAVIEWSRKLLWLFPRLLPQIKEALCAFPQFLIPMDIAVDVCRHDWAKKEPYERIFSKWIK